LNILNNFISLFSICQKTHQELQHIKYNEHHAAGVWTKSTGVSHALAASHVQPNSVAKQNRILPVRRISLYMMHAITYLKLLRNYTFLINIAKVMCSCHLTFSFCNLPLTSAIVESIELSLTSLSISVKLPLALRNLTLYFFLLETIPNDTWERSCFPRFFLLPPARVGFFPNCRRFHWSSETL